MPVLLALRAWLGTAEAAVPVALPAGEPVAAWSDAARIAGARIGAATGAPSAVVVANGTRWTIQVVARDGTRHTLVVPVPATAAAREDLLATIVSLAEPVAAALPPVVLPPAPLPPAPPAKPAPPKRASPRPSSDTSRVSGTVSAPTAAAPSVRSAPAEPAPAETPPASLPSAGLAPPAELAMPDALAPAPDAEPGDAGAPAGSRAEAAPPPEPVLDALVADGDASAPDPTTEPVAASSTEPARPPLLDLDTPTVAPARRVPLYARLAPSLVVRTDATPVAGLALTGGVGLGRARVGLSVAGTLPATLAADRAVQAADLALVLELGDRGPWAAARAGVAIRGWSEGGTSVATTFTPTARLDAGWGFPVGETRIRPAAWAAADLASTTLYVAGIEEGTFDRVFFGIDLGVELGRTNL